VRVEAETVAGEASGDETRVLPRPRPTAAKPDEAATAIAEVAGILPRQHPRPEGVVLRPTAEAATVTPRPRRRDVEA
jgi:hypothetical protein